MSPVADRSATSVSSPKPKRPRVLLLGASGCVGGTLYGQLRSRDDIDIVLAGRRVRLLQRRAAATKSCIAVRGVNLDRRGSLDNALADDPSLIVNCSGRFREHGMQVAHAAAERGIDLIDIADEPVYLREVAQLDSTAKRTGSRLVIGSGAAPQTTGAMVRLAVLQLTLPLKVTVAVCFGANRIGPNAARTATEAVGGWLSIPGAPKPWTKGPIVDFGHPFGRLRVRHYPLPETFVLPRFEGVTAWVAGATNGSPSLNILSTILKTLFLTRQPHSSILIEGWVRLAAAFETMAATTGIAKKGIAFYVEVVGQNGTIISRLYHRDMTSLTVDALQTTLEQVIRRDSEPGVHLAHDFIEPQPFLEHLKTTGATWLMEPGHGCS